MAAYQGPFRRISAIRCGYYHGLGDARYPYLVSGEMTVFARRVETGTATFAPFAGLASAAIGLGAYRPSMFSGEMRAVCQSLLAQGIAIPWSPTFALTHGIVTSTDAALPERQASTAYSAGDAVLAYSGGPMRVYEAATSGTTSGADSAAIVWPETLGETVTDGSVVWECARIWAPKWVVEVSAAGALAWPLTLSAWRGPGDPEGLFPAGLDYRPAATPKPASGVLTLLDAAGIAPAYAKSPFYGDCGWAFSASGAQAANCVYSAEAHPLGGSYHRSVLYRVDIDATLTATGELTGATLVEEDADWVWSDLVEHLKVPDHSAGKLVSVDMRAGNASAPAAALGPAPIHVWYEGEEQRRVTFTIEETSSESGTNSDGTTWWRQTGGMYFTSPAFSAPLQDESLFGYHYSPWETLYVTPGDLHEVYASSSNHYRGERRFRTLTMYPGTNAATTQDLVAVPLNERQAIYHVRKTEGNAYYNYSEQYTNVATHLLGPGAFPEGANASPPGLADEDSPSCSLSYTSGKRNILTGRNWDGYTYTDCVGLSGAELPQPNAISIPWVIEGVMCQDQWVISGVDPYYFASADAALSAYLAQSGASETRRETSVVGGRQRVTLYVDDGAGGEVLATYTEHTHLAAVGIEVLRAETIDPVPVFVSSTSGSRYELEAAAWVNGTQHAVTIDTDDVDDWFLFIDPEVTTQRLVACADASPAGEQVYATRLVLGAEALAPALSGPADYPVADILGTSLFWAGSP